MTSKKGKKKSNRCMALGMSVVLAVSVLCGCGKEAVADKATSTKVVLTTGFDNEEVFRISKSSCSKPEAMVYLTNMQNQYEEVYGEQIWETNIDGVTLEQKVKDTVIARIAQVKTMALLAESYHITLDAKKQKLVKEAAKTYYDSLNKQEIEAMGVEEKTIEQLYTEYELANLVYEKIIADVNPEISDDEARTIKVMQIFIKTYTQDGAGERILYNEEQKKEAHDKARTVLEKIAEGEDFEVLAEKYSDDTNITYSFGKGEMEEEFEKVSFNLDSGEVSDIVETEYGYYIIKCVSTFDVKETDANKEKIVEKRKAQAFNEVYNGFVSGLDRNLNEELWKGVEMIHDPQVKTSDFFQVFSKFIKN